MKIENSVILVTGGTSGIGECIARCFMKKGGLVYVCGSNEEKGRTFEKSTNSIIKFIKCDITNEESVFDMIEKIKIEQGKLDILINSAGMFLVELMATEKSSHSKDTFEKIIKTNVVGSFLVSKYASKLMIQNFDSKKDCNGIVIFIGSIVAFEGQKGQTAYSASKGALVGMTLPMARDLGKYKIRVNTIAPGVIETPMNKGVRYSKLGKIIMDATPLRTLGEPFNVCQTAKYIVTNDFVNGSVIRVDGGIRLHHF